MPDQLFSQKCNKRSLLLIDVVVLYDFETGKLRADLVKMLSSMKDNKPVIAVYSALPQNITIFKNTFEEASKEKMRASDKEADEEKIPALKHNYVFIDPRGCIKKSLFRKEKSSVETTIAEDLGQYAFSPIGYSLFDGSKDSVFFQKKAYNLQATEQMMVWSPYNSVIQSSAFYGCHTMRIAVPGSFQDVISQRLQASAKPCIFAVDVHDTLIFLEESRAQKKIVFNKFLINKLVEYIRSDSQRSFEIHLLSSRQYAKQNHDDLLSISSVDMAFREYLEAISESDNLAEKFTLSVCVSDTLKWPTLNDWADKGSRLVIFMDNNVAEINAVQRYCDATCVDAIHVSKFTNENWRGKIASWQGISQSQGVKLATSRSRLFSTGRLLPELDCEYDLISEAEVVPYADGHSGVILNMNNRGFKL